MQIEILEPAVEGTLNVLRSCKKNPCLKRVILTSSSSAVRVRDDFDPLVPLDESSWSSVEICERLQVSLLQVLIVVGTSLIKTNNYHIIYMDFYSSYFPFLFFFFFMEMKIWYALSKTLAENAAWEFCNKNGISLITILPAFVIGPSLPPELCSTASDVLGLLKGSLVFLS